MEGSSGRKQMEMDSLHHRRLLPHEPFLALQSVLDKDGQVKDVEAEPVIIGGMVLDIHATPSIPANPRTTTPGKVQYILGGVARNIAECMSKLETVPYMISAVGLDMAGNLLLEHWKSAGLSLEGIRRHQDIETAVVLNIFDVKGEVAAGVARVEAIEKFVTPDWIQQFNWNIRSAPVVVVDANLSPPALEASCRSTLFCICISLSLSLSLSFSLSLSLGVNVCVSSCILFSEFRVQCLYFQAM
ncbi:hypothetical protein U1Q18_003883 [Sarracenia purpurea var. burkii]